MGSSGPTSVEDPGRIGRNVPTLVRRFLRSASSEQPSRVGHSPVPQRVWNRAVDGIVDVTVPPSLLARADEAIE